MIQDLKADSARWDAERRAASRGQPGGAGGTELSSHPNASFVRRSNSPTAIPRGNDGYRNSETHQQRQYYGPTSAADPAAYGDPMAVDPPTYNQPPMRYPGTGNSGYNGVNSATYAAHQAAHQQRYETQQASYGNPTSAAQYAAAQQQTYSPGPPADINMYGAASMPAGPGMVSQVPFGQPPSAQDPSQYVRGAAFAQNPMVTSSVAPNRNMYATAGAVYPTPGDYSYSQTGGVPLNTAGYTQPQDILYGRGSSSQQPNTIPAPSDYLASPAGNQPPVQTGYSTVGPGAPYKEAQTPSQIQSQNPVQPPSRNSVGPTPSSQAQISSSGQNPSATATNARRDRDQDRHRGRDGDRDRDSDRHAAERHAHRHRTR